MRRDVAILTSDKGNGAVLIDNVDYCQSLEHLFIDKNNFKQTYRGPTMTQLSTSQNYLMLLIKRGELTEEQYKKLRPQNARARRAHA